jgi:hypothetical protein
MKDNKIPPMDVWQLEQQCLVSGSTKVIFTISNLVDKGEKRKDPISVTYKSKKTIRKRLIAGWKLFAKDLEEYKKNMDEQEEVECEVVPIKIKSLPALKFEMSSEIKSSTISKYAESADGYLEKIKTDLVTDQDFSDAEVNIKFCDAAREQVKYVKENALAENISIKDALDALDEIDEKFRLMSKKLTGSVKDKKTQIKDGIINEASKTLQSDIQEANNRTRPYKIPDIKADFKLATKNKKTIKSVQSSVNAELTRVLMELGDLEEIILKNKEIIEKVGDGYGFLFNDAADFIGDDPGVVISLVRSRIDEYEKEVKEKAMKDEQNNIQSSIYDDPTEMQDQYGDGKQNVDVIDFPVKDVTREAKLSAWYSLGNLGFDKDTATKFVTAVAEGHVSNIILVK